LEDVQRVVCAEAADLDADGDMDIVVCVFGETEGKVLWLEQKQDLEFDTHVLDPRGGAIHAFPFDAAGDEDLDIAVALAEDFEEILLFRNDGNGGFKKEVLFAAGTPSYGTSGIELADLDRDGDTEAHGFNPNLSDVDPYEFYGLSWLENDGSGNFAVHDIVRHWGAYTVRAVDLDGDEDLDLFLAAFQIPMVFPDDRLESMIWLENDGAQGFTPRKVDLGLPLTLAIEVVDVEGDGVPEILASSHDFIGGDLGHRLVIFNIPIEGE
jgi:hypothetical protein